MSTKTGYDIYVAIENLVLWARSKKIGCAIRE
jgi:hypothetical protein